MKVVLKPGCPQAQGKFWKSKFSTWQSAQGQGGRGAEQGLDMPGRDETMNLSSHLNFNERLLRAYPGQCAVLLLGNKDPQGRKGATG